MKTNDHDADPILTLWGELAGALRVATPYLPLEAARSLIAAYQQLHHSALHERTTLLREKRDLEREGFEQHELIRELYETIRELNLMLQTNRKLHTNLN